MIEYTENFLFHSFQIPPKDGNQSPKTFIALPPPHMMLYFSAITCMNEDEIDAHINMFDPVLNHYYYDLGHVTLEYLREMVNKSAE